MRKSINLRLLLLYVYAFILMYSPNFAYLIKINNFILYIGATFVYLCIYASKRENGYSSYFKKKPISIFIILNILATFYYAMRTILAGTEITDISNLRIIHNMMPIFYLMGALIVYHELELMKFTKKEKYKFIINVALIQSFISIAMIFFPSFRNIALNIFYSNHEFNEYITRSRLYGICDGDYTYGFQILHSILALFIMMFAYFYKEKKYIIYSLLTIMVTFLNGRFGVIIFTLALLYFVLYIMIKKLEIFKALKILLIALFIGSALLTLIYFLLPDTFIIIEHAYNDVISFINEDNENSETGSLVSMIIFPAGIYMIFGCGFRVFGNGGNMYGFYQGSDIGFVNDAFMGGVIYMTTIYLGYLYFIKYIKLFFKKFEFENMMSKLLIISMILANIKGELFRSYLLVANIILLLIFMMLSGGKKNVEK